MGRRLLSWSRLQKQQSSHKKSLHLDRPPSFTQYTINVTRMVYQHSWTYDLSRLSSHFSWYFPGSKFDPNAQRIIKQKIVSTSKRNCFSCCHCTCRSYLGCRSLIKYIFVLADLANFIYIFNIQMSRREVSSLID